MTLIRSLIASLALVFLLPTGVLAGEDIITPDSGWWYQKGASGRGYAIEVQDNVAFIAAFTYDPVQTDGVHRPIWFASAGTLIDDDVFEGVFDLYENGQCIGCAYTAPNVPGVEKHNLRIEFLTATTANLTLDGDTFPIERFYFAPSYTNVNEIFLGQWLLTMNTPSSFGNSLANPITGQALVFDRVEEAEDGDIDIWGCAVSDITLAYCPDNSKLALAWYNEEFDDYSILLEIRSSAWRHYRLLLSTDKVIGFVDQHIPNAPFSYDRAEFVRGHRTISKTLVQIGTGPGKADARIQKGTNSELTIEQQETRAALRKAMHDLRNSSSR